MQITHGVSGSESIEVKVNTYESICLHNARGREPGISVSEFGAKYGWTVAGDLKERINLDIGLSWEMSLSLGFFVWERQTWKSSVTSE